MTRNITFTAAEFPDVEARKQAFSDEALRLNELGYNIYTPHNPIEPSFAGNMTNNRAVCDKDIACRRLLLLDLDRTGKLADPATDAEIAEAAKVADRISVRLREEFGVELHRTMSGNGHHLYLPLDDIPNDLATKRCCQRLLIALAQQFDTATIKVDTSVYNASRITKVPGTIARKGLETPDRPYRRACVL